jgi:hypothetical protein
MQAGFNPYTNVRPQQSFPQSYGAYPPQYSAPTQQFNPAQLMGVFKMLMGAMQQLSMGWQGFAGNPFGMQGQQPSPYGANPAYGVSQVGFPQTGYGYGGPVSPNPNPYSLLPAGQSSSPTSYGSFQVFNVNQVQAGPAYYGGPISANPNPYSLLPAGQHS